MAATIQDVAQLAGVSTATVSRALRGFCNVSDSTRTLVVAAALQLGYVKPGRAQRQMIGATRTVGVVVPHMARWFFGQVVWGAEAVLRRAGYDMLLFSLADAAGRSRFFRQVPARGRVDAMLVLSLPLTEVEVSCLRGLNVPVALVGSVVPGFSSVRIDDVDAARRAVQHLVSLGHRRIGLIAGERDEPMLFTAPLDRRRGYQAALRAGGLTVDPSLEAAGDFSVQGGALAMHRLLSLARPPTAVLAESDEMAMGALGTLRRQGLRVPRDVSVIGVDDHEMAELLDLSTVAQPVREQGALAARILLRALTEPGHRPEHVLLETRLVVRPSLGPAPAPSRPHRVVGARR